MSGRRYGTDKKETYVFTTLSLVIEVYSWIVLLWAVSTWLPEEFQRSIRPAIDPIVEPPVNAISQLLPDGFRQFSVLVLLIGLHVLRRLF